MTYSPTLPPGCRIRSTSAATAVVRGDQFVVTLFLFAAPARTRRRPAPALNVPGRLRRVLARCADGGTPAEGGRGCERARIVSNHLSQADSWLFRVLTPIACASARPTSVSRWPVARRRPPSTRSTCRRRSRSEAEERGARRHQRRAPRARRGVEAAALFPGGPITNGRGLMRFSAFVFGLDAGDAGRLVLGAVAARVDTVWSPLHWNLRRTRTSRATSSSSRCCRRSPRAPARSCPLAERTATDLANEPARRDAAHHWRRSAPR